MELSVKGVYRLKEEENILEDNYSRNRHLWLEQYSKEHAYYSKGMRMTSKQRVLVCLYISQR